MFDRVRDWLLPSSENARPTLRADWVPQDTLPTRPASAPPHDERMPFWLRDDGVLPPPGLDPRLLFPMLRAMRDYIPDVSAGVWAWVRLCSTTMNRRLEGSESECEKADAVLDRLDDRVFGGWRGQERGLEALMRALFLSAFTYGAFCGEVVLTPDRRRIERFIVIDPATIRFKRDAETRDPIPFQIQNDSTLIKLNPTSFFYYGLDLDGLSPYGRSPLLALPLAVKLQQQMLRDMARAHHNAGYPTIHFKLTPSARERGESPADYNQRLRSEMDAMRGEILRRQADSNLLTYDNVEVNYIGPGGESRQWLEPLQAMSEQVVSALHLAPFMIGRNWGTTESWGAAQYQLVVNNARTVQFGARRLAEWLMNLELALNGSPVRARAAFEPHHHFDLHDRARSFNAIARTVAMLHEKGLIDSDESRRRIEESFKLI